MLITFQTSSSATNTSITCNGKQQESVFKVAADNPLPPSSDGHYEEIPGARETDKTVQFTMENGVQAFSQDYISGVKDLPKDKESLGTVV